jgi:hypothetical protein
MPPTVKATRLSPSLAPSIARAKTLPEPTDGSYFALNLLQRPPLPARNVTETLRGKACIVQPLDTSNHGTPAGAPDPATIGRNGSL